MSASGPSPHTALSHKLGRYRSQADVVTSQMTPRGSYRHTGPRRRYSPTPRWASLMCRSTVAIVSTAPHKQRARPSAVCMGRGIIGSCVWFSMHERRWPDVCGSVCSYQINAKPILNLFVPGLVFITDNIATGGGGRVARPLSILRDQSPRRETGLNSGEGKPKRSICPRPRGNRKETASALGEAR